MDPGDSGGAYQAELGFPVVRLVVCDDAPQVTFVSAELALCWFHEGRHYKKLVPYVPHHRALVEDFVPRFWTYYDQLLAYQEQPTPARRRSWTASSTPCLDGHGLYRA